MINIPTELLRTLVAVVDLRSFTRAAQSLGVTQPAVSAQIKRLHLLLDCELLDKSAPGVSLTPAGRVVLNFARRMLNINDQIVELSVPKTGAAALRIGLSGDLLDRLLPPLLSDFKLRYPGLRFSVRSEPFAIMTRDLQRGDLDLLVGLYENGLLTDARHQNAEPMVWVRDPSFQLDADAPVPLVTFGAVCAYHRVALTALERIRRSCEVVFTGSSQASIVAAIRGGLGVGAMPHRLAREADFEPWDHPPLPHLNDIFCGIYLSENGDPILEELADAIYELLYPTARPQTEQTLVSTGSI